MVLNGQLLVLMGQTLINKRFNEKIAYVSLGFHLGVFVTAVGMVISLQHC